MDDCYFFLTTGCNKGDACKFRHSLAAKASQETCLNYINTGTCNQADCGKRHSSFHLRTTNNIHTNNNNSHGGKGNGNGEVCYFERVKGACTKDSCQFKHFSKSSTTSAIEEQPPRAPRNSGKEAAWREAVDACTCKLSAIEDRLAHRFTKLDGMFQDFTE